MKGNVILSGALFLILIGMFQNKEFFSLMYNSKLGRFILVCILIALTLSSVFLGVLLLIVIIFLSHNKKKINIEKKMEPEEPSERVNMSEVITRTITDKPNDTISFKNYNKYQYKKSKRKGGVNILQINELMKPKSSKSEIIIPNIPNIEILPYSNKNFYNLN